MDSRIINVYTFFKTAHEIINSFDPPLDEDETMRQLCILIAEKARFFPEYTFANITKKEEIYMSRYSDDESERKKMTKDILSAKVGDDEWELICTQLAIMLAVIGKRFGVDVEVVKEDDSYEYSHCYNRVTRKDGTQYYIDLHDDLRNYQSHAKTKDFGVSKDHEKIIGDERLKEIDLRLGYITEDKPYADVYLEELKERIAEIGPIHEKLMYLLQNISVHPDEKLLGYNEIKFHHMDVIRNTIGSNAFEQCHFLNCDKMEIPWKRRYVPIVYVEERTDGYVENEYRNIYDMYDEHLIGHYYVLDESGKKYREASPIEIVVQVKDGLHIANFMNYKELIRASKEISPPGEFIGFDPHEYY